MDILFFADPSEVPLPPEEVRIRELRADPYPDGRRVRVYLEVDPFQRRPSAELAIVDSQDKVVASANIIESMTRKMEMTLHLRNASPGDFTLQATLLYSQIEKPPEPAPDEGAGADPAAENTAAGDTPAPIQTMVVDTATCSFTVTPAES